MPDDAGIDVTELDVVGRFQLVESARFADVFLCRIAHESADVPDGMASAGDGQCIAAFSRLCTHMSCYLVHQDDGMMPLDSDGQARCQCDCHLSSFDLERHGLPINAPATACLPQVRLERIPADTSQPIEQVELVEWMSTASVPYGIPHGGTSENPAAGS